MARDLAIIDHNTITLFDPVEKCEVVFYHRTPTTDDRVRYMTGRYKREGTRLVDRSRSAAVDAAAEVLTGIRPGDFTVGGVPIASDPASEHYREDWKDLVRAAAGDLLFLMGHDLFEGRISLDKVAGMEIVSEFSAGATGAEGEKEAETELPPLSRSSAACATAAPPSGASAASRETAPRPSRKSAGAARRGKPS